jgi:hypothetical protein
MHKLNLFQSLCLKHKTNFYDRAATAALNSGGNLSYIMDADRVAKKCIRIETCDRQAAENSISNRVQAAKRRWDELGEASVVL